ncbi:hypothetical protein OZX67_03905 [Bifidobacterium sp. ESL0728]|uniref:hypothetical protein n=1 Tax=Bifidobacterium sp. ESL0728 TaxID=2983220 RepID=UPI0023F68BA5|nr:hypothetical protein [Bifidobacterium sp. ESL0728]WEV59692.1 hypothetical protein OZX67_03905 [Bifidobacterium sp. ESL0728]
MSDCLINGLHTLRCDWNGCGRMMPAGKGYGSYREASREAGRHGWTHCVCSRHDLCPEHAQPMTQGKPEREEMNVKKHQTRINDALRLIRMGDDDEAIRQITGLNPEAIKSLRNDIEKETTDE